jgi:tetratricopeptide (TPR) repeat protein
LEQAARLLRATRHLLITDNAESITAAAAAIPHALPSAERDQLKTLLSRLRGGLSLVLIGSRAAETWLGPGGAGPARYLLPGLDPQAASILVERILRRHGAAGHVQDVAQRTALQDLITLLGGYPLPLTVVLPALATATPASVLAELEAGGSAADPAGLISRAIEYSHGKLDPAIQNSLLLLAPFTAVIPTGPALHRYRELLWGDEAVRGLGRIDLDAALDQAVSVGLAAPHPQVPAAVQVQPVLPYFLRSRLHDQPALQAAAAQAHNRLYADLGPELHEMLTSPGDPQQHAAGQAAIRAHYANLTAALGHGLRTGQPISPVITALDRYLDQAQQHAARRQLLDDAIAASPPRATEEQHQQLAQLHNLAGIAALREHRLDDAKSFHEAELRLKQACGDRWRQAMAHGQLGIVAQEQRRFEEAEASCRQALKIFLEEDDRHRAAAVYHQLGMIAGEQGRFGEAEASYRRALAIFLEAGDRRTAANTYHQLGMVAQKQRRFGEAEASYMQAVTIKLEFGDRHGAAGTYHELGGLAKEQGRLEEAGYVYRQALAIFLDFSDDHGAASTYHNLARIAQGQHRLEEAEDNLRQALRLKLESGDRYGAAATYRGLGLIAQEQGRLDDAEASYRPALDIYLESGDPHSAAQTRYNLGQVA